MLKNITLLYVEDEENLKNIVKNYFSNLFKEIITAKDGQEGFEKYQENSKKIDVIVTDINMPKLNGLDMIRLIRETNPQIPVIITSAYNENNYLHEAISLGVNNFVLKPIDIKILLNNIKKAVEPIILKEEIEKEIVKNAKAKASEKLAAGLTHEINTPLTYIKANFEMIQYDIEDLPQSKTKEHIIESISKINCGINRIETIVNSIKELSMENDESFEVSNIYSTIITALTISYNKIKHISKVYVNGELFSLDSNKDKLNFQSNIQKHRIEQLWIIIILNALDELVKIENFKDRKLEINVSEDENFIKIVFSDNAGGINTDIIDKVFEPFKGTKSSSGMGVGLSIAKKIIDDHNGARIKAYNQNNHAVFEINLPKLKD